MGGSFALQKWFGLYLEGILSLKTLREKKMMLVPCRGIELPIVYQYSDTYLQR